MTRAIAIVFLMILGLAPVAGRQSDPIDTIVRDEMATQRIPGMAVAVVRRGEVVSAKGYGLANVEHIVPATDRTIFQSGSLGKQFTATAVMLQVQDGRLSLVRSDREVLRRMARRSWRDITVRHLLTHTSGIPDYNDGQLDLPEGLHRRRARDVRRRRCRSISCPASEWKYSNTGYILLGALVRKVSGSFYGDVLRDRVFQAAGHERRRGSSARPTSCRIVPPAIASIDGELRNQEWVSPQWNTTADGSLYLSLQDLIAWDRGIRERRGAQRRQLAPGVHAREIE